MRDVPLMARVAVPSVESADVVTGAPGAGPGNWSGAPSAWIADGVTYLAYRMRGTGAGARGYAVVVAASHDGTRFETLLSLDKESFGAASLERPALVRRPDGGWRLYMCCATPNSAHWWIDAIDASDPGSFDASERVTVVPGDSTMAVKDPVVTIHNGRWLMWACRHPLGDPEATDRMTSWFASSEDGLTWTGWAEALTARPGSWFQRGARIADVRLVGQTWVAYFDGRASALENGEERTGLAVGDRPDQLRPLGSAPLSSSPWGSGSLRYLSAVDLGEGNHRLYFEACMPDGSHALLTQLVELDTPLNQPAMQAALPVS